MDNPYTEVRLAEVKRMQSSWSARIADERPWLEAWIRKRTGSNQQIDEIMQELNLACLESDDVPESPERFKAWLARVLIRQCALLIRNKTRHERKLRQFSELAPEPFAQDPLLAILARERHETLRAELGKLDTETRDWLIKKYVHGFSYQQIADHAQTTRHVVEYRLIQVRGELQIRLSEQGIAPEDPAVNGDS